jgi:hypothetical protein
MKLWSEEKGTRRNEKQPMPATPAIPETGDE